MNFKEFLTESWISDTYKLPKDKEKQMFDFYVFSDIYNQSNNSSFSKYDFGQQQKKIKFQIDQIADALLPAIKDSLLEATFFSVACEMRHAVEEARIKPGDHHTYGPDDHELQLEEYVSDSLGAKYGKIIKNFFNTLRNQHAEIGRTGRDKSQDANINLKSRKRLAGSSSDSHYRDSYIAATLADPQRKNFIHIAEFVFNPDNFIWEEGFGGNAWQTIANSWKTLNAANTSNKITMIQKIDRVFSLQHNSDTVFNKIVQWSKNAGFSWIAKALNLKAEAKHPFEMIHKCSSTIQGLARSFYKSTSGASSGQYTQIRYIHHEESPIGWTIEWTNAKGGLVIAKYTYNQLLEILESSNPGELVKKYGPDFLTTRNPNNPGLIGREQIANYIIKTIGETFGSDYDNIKQIKKINRHKAIELFRQYVQRRNNSSVDSWQDNEPALPSPDTIRHFKHRWGIYIVHTTSTPGSQAAFQFTWDEIYKIFQLLDQNKINESIEFLLKLHKQLSRDKAKRILRYLETQISLSDFLPYIRKGTK